MQYCVIKIELSKIPPLRDYFCRSYVFMEGGCACFPKRMWSSGAWRASPGFYPVPLPLPTSLWQGSGPTSINHRSGFSQGGTASSVLRVCCISVITCPRKGQCVFWWRWDWRVASSMTVTEHLRQDKLCNTYLMSSSGSWRSKTRQMLESHIVS